MTVTTTTNKSALYTGNGTASVFAFTFRIIADSDLEVTQTTDAGVASVLTLDTDYSVTQSGVGGSITLLAGVLASGYTLLIKRVRPMTQLTDIRNQGDYFPERHEDALDHLLMVDQQQQESIDRSVKMGVTSATTPPAFPEPVNSGVVRWNADGSALEAKANADLGLTAANVANVAAGNLSSVTVQTALDELQTDIDTRATSSDLSAHTGNVANPHTVTAEQITADAIITEVNSKGSGVFDWVRLNKTGSNLTDIATRSHTALSDIGTNTHAQIDSHIGATTGNPHNVGPSDVGSATAQWNASTVKGVPVEDADIGDGKVLTYIASSEKLEYRNPPESGLPTLGDAEQVLKVNAAGNALEYATLSGTEDQITVTKGVGTVALSLPQDIATTSSPEFAGATLTEFSGAVKATAGVLSAGPIVDDDIDAAAALAWTKISKVGSNLTDIATRSHTSLSDIGTNTHAQIDTAVSASTSHIANTSNPHGTTKTHVGLGNVTDDAQIAKSIGTTKGDIIAYSGSATPVRLPVGATTGHVLTVDPAEATGVKWAAQTAAPVLSFLVSKQLNSQNGSNGAYIALTSLVIPAGDWEISGKVYVGKLAATTWAGGIRVAISTDSAAATGCSSGDTNLTNFPPSALTSTAAVDVVLPVHRVSLAEQTTYYLNVLTQFTGDAPAVRGVIQARKFG